MISDELLDRGIERKATDSHKVHRHSLFLENVERFANSGVAAADCDHSDLRPGTPPEHRRRHEASRFLMLPQQAIHHFLILVRNFGITALFVVARSSREKRSFR